MTARRFRIQLGVVLLLTVGVTSGVLWIFGFSTPVLAALLVGAILAGVPLSYWLSASLRRLARAAEAFDDVPPSHRGSEVDRLVHRFQAARRRLDEQLETITLDRNKLTAILGSMVEGVLAVDADERLVHVNQVAIELLSLTKDGELSDRDLRGRPIHELTRQRIVLEALTRALSDNEVVNSILTMGEGRAQRVLELSATPLRNGARGNHGAVLVLHDVTQLHRLEGIRRDFVSNVSHELKTPLTAIRGFVETLLENPDLEPERQHRFLEKISAQTRRLATLVTDLLSLSRIESSPEEHRIPVDLRMPLMESLRTLRPVIEEREIDLQYELPEAPVVRQGDVEGFRQAFSNLIDNALKYTPAGKRVWVELQYEPDRIVFAVRDEGPGIDKKDQERVFERFYRVDKARSRQLGGTGLGLAIVKNVAMNSGGSVEVESRPGHGSTFRIVWPIADEAPSGPRLTGHDVGNRPLIDPS